MCPDVHTEPRENRRRPLPPAPLPVSGLAAREDATVSRPDFRGSRLGGYVSCRNALSDSGSLVTVSMLKRGEESLNPFTMQ
jgi:hypothetical protein